ncbi:MAG: hydrogenase formation protein HypD, partial [bacterium]|nr:hydrogenase formation protein HypD [bacterium]
MRYLDEYRDPKAAQELAAAIRSLVTQPWTLMEVCGGQTHTILKTGLEALLPAEITLVHGPGCPVCVTPPEQIDKAVAISLTPGVIFCSFGDMLRVPGSTKSLFEAKAEGADVRIVYSPLDAVKLARDNPDH